MTTESPVATSLEVYFAAQRADFVVTTIASLTMVVVAVLLARRPDGFDRGLAIMLAVTALIVVGAGIYVQVRNVGMVPTLLDAARSPLASDTAVLARESERMAQLMANFAVARRAYAGLLIVSAVTIAAAPVPLWRGFGAGVAVMAITGYLIDHYAEIRADRYLQALLEAGIGR